MNFKDIIERISKIKCIQYSDRGHYKEIDFDYYDDILNMGFKLTEEDKNLKLYVEKNSTAPYLEKYDWPGTKEDYNDFVNSLSDLNITYNLPQLIISLLKEKNENNQSEL